MLRFFKCQDEIVEIDRNCLFFRIAFLIYLIFQPASRLQEQIESARSRKSGIVKASDTSKLFLLPPESQFWARVNFPILEPEFLSLAAFARF